MEEPGMKLPLAFRSKPLHFTIKEGMKHSKEFKDIKAHFSVYILSKLF